MSRGYLAMMVLVAGLVLAFLGLAADAVGLGSSPGMGTLQIIALVLGIAMVLVGFFMRRR